MHWLIQRIRDFGDRIALAGHEGEVSYWHLGERILHCVEQARQCEVKPGSVVAIVGDYSPVSVAWFLALAELKCIVVPLAGSAAEHPQKLRLAGVNYVVQAQTPILQKLEATGDRPCLLDQLSVKGGAGLILFSSGSSGEPKGMLHDLDALLDTYQEQRPKNLVLMVLLLFDHIGGINTLFHSLATGAKLVVPGNRSPDEVAALIERHRVAVLPASPTFLNLLLVSANHRQHDLSSLRIITYGTEPMAATLLQRLRNAFPKARLIQTFGTSETGIFRTSSPSSDSLWMRMDDPNREWKIVDGELWLRSRTQILGYLNYPMDRFTSDGWFRTGDQAEQRPDGSLRILGRRGELINVGGEKVWPAEVESVVLTIAGVVDCRVSGEANPITGQSVVAEVVAMPGVDLESLKMEIRRTCRARLSAYKTPTRVTFLESLGNERLKKTRKPGSLSGPGAARS